MEVYRINLKVRLLDNMLTTAKANKSKSKKSKKHGHKREMSGSSRLHIKDFCSRFNLSSSPCSPGESLSLERKQFMRGHIREFLGTQQPIITCRTGVTTLTTSGTNLTQVVSMDVTGVAAWSSIANLFDEYRVRKACLHVVPLYSGFGSAATALAAMPVINVIDYDDSTALASLTNAVQSDTSEIMHFGKSNSKVMRSKVAHPEGQPDLAWVTTASPTVPFWFKFWSISTLVPSTAAIGYCFIELDLELRQLA